ncbi:phenazine antibiotic biosynthesis protein [Actinokineospora sp. G85]|uniref:phenazine antibiotic biosynthesis protein n=1 Tax=Actinokineospora sp. G85 TaxID=3406626 RepID=UPI003C71E797
MTTPASALDLPWDSPPGADDLVREAIDWHFDPATGSPFWLERARTLDFDPRADVRTVADLKRFPNIIDELRDIALERLVPQGYKAVAGHNEPPLAGESGGTTGAAKRVFSFADVRDASWSWYWGRLREHKVPAGRNWLGVVPAGPHMIGKLTRDAADHFGGIYFTVDLDPRWAKRCIATGNGQALKDYVDHMVDQIEPILLGQDIGVLAITPPLLDALCRRDRLVEVIKEKVAKITWSGASMDSDTALLLRTEVFPEIDVIGIFGSTMIFCGIPQRPGGAPTDPAVFDPPSPFSIFDVVDGETLETVEVGQRGQMLSHHLTRNLFLPNNLERDTAIRHEHGLGLHGDAVSEVRPVETFGGNKVIEGVY